MGYVEGDDMNVIKAEVACCIHVETDEPEYNEYTRWGPECWTVRMGESDEQVYDTESLELEYQRYVAKNP